MTQERRRFSRVSYSEKCFIKENSAEPSFKLETEILDLSLNGALIHRPDDWCDELNKEVTLFFTLSGSDINLLIKGVICHSEEKVLGMKFVSLELESITHLKRLIELNLGDNALLHRELSQLINGE